MPHFVIECSENILTLKKPKEIIQAVFDTAESTNLFAKSGASGIKVRINTYKYYTTVNSNDDFIHVFAYIVEGRTTDQKKDLSKTVVSVLSNMFPSVSIISVDIREIKKDTFINKSML